MKPRPREMTVVCFALAALAYSCQSGGNPEGEATSARADEPTAQRSAAAVGDVEEEQPRELSWDEPIRVDRGDASRGPWRMNESDFHYIDDPTVALSKDGTAFVAWVDNRRQDVLFQRFGADGETQLEVPVDISRSPDIFSWLPRLVVVGDEGETVYAVWQEIVFSGGSHGGEIFFARSTDGGESFSEPANLSQTTAGAGKGRLTSEHWHNGSLDIAVSADTSELSVAWTEYEGALRFSRSVDGGQNFSAPEHIAGATDGNDPPARGPSIAAGENGEVYLAWTVGEKDDADIRVAHSEDGGRSFGEATVAEQTGGHSDGPKIAVDSAGDLHLVFAESPHGLYERSHIRYLSKPADEEAFGTSRIISAEPTDEDETAASFPSLAIDGDDDLFVLWEHHPQYGERPRGLGFSFSTDQGATFSAPSIIDGTDDRREANNGNLQGLLMRKLAVNDVGDVAAVHSTFEENQESLIVLFFGRL